MSIQRRVIYWVLEYHCPLRPVLTESIQDTHLRLRDAQIYRDFLVHKPRREEIYDDVLLFEGDRITVPEAVSKKRFARYSDSGKDLTPLFHRAGGRRELHMLCEKCPANAFAPHPAGCLGNMDFFPTLGNLESYLRERTSEEGLKRALAPHFLLTYPLLNSLWVNSPIPYDGLLPLQQLLAEPAETNKEWDFFCQALKLAHENHLRLHVTLSPPGFSSTWDGNTTYKTHPHCPSCKVRYSPRFFGLFSRRTRPYRCSVCNYSYVPAETESEEETRRSYKTLRDTLTSQRLETVNKLSLVAQGFSMEAISEILKIAEAEHLRETFHSRLREAYWWLEQENSRGIRLLQWLSRLLFMSRQKHREWAKESKQTHTNQKFLLEVIFAGVPKTLQNGYPLFTADSFAKILLRCQEHQVTVESMGHFSKETALFRSVDFKQGDSTEPLALLEQWCTEGCQEQFWGIFDVVPPSGYPTK
jgi:transposase-like protein